MLWDGRESFKRVKIGVVKDLFVERGFFVVKKGPYMTFDTIRHRESEKRESKSEEKKS